LAGSNAISSFAVSYLVTKGPGALRDLTAELVAAPDSPGRNDFLAGALFLQALATPADTGQYALDLIAASKASGDIAVGLGTPLASAPDTAIELAGHLSAGSRERFLRDFASRAAHLDPPAAAAALAASAGSPAAPLAAREFLSEWAFDDLLSASAWLGTLPEGETRDAGVAALARRLAPVDPGGAREWIDSIDDPTRRLEAIAYTYQRWSYSDPASARAWLEGSGLSPADLTDSLPPTKP
jgi:hypothetical protein